MIMNKLKALGGYLAITTALISNQIALAQQAVSVAPVTKTTPQAQAESAASNLLAKAQASTASLQERFAVATANLDTITTTIRASIFGKAGSYMVGLLRDAQTAVTDMVNNLITKAKAAGTGKAVEIAAKQAGLSSGMAGMLGDAAKRSVTGESLIDPQKTFDRRALHVETLKALGTTRKDPTTLLKKRASAKRPAMRGNSPRPVRHGNPPTRRDLTGQSQPASAQKINKASKAIGDAAHSEAL